MKKIDFKTLEITNFLSIGKTQKFDFSDGISTIFGINHDKINDQNGSGKSSLLAAVAFALFGDPIKNIKREEVVNRIAGSKCSVKLDFDVEENGTKNEYSVERGVKPGYCKLVENGVDISLSGMPETTKKINDIIGTSASMFKNTCLMTLEDSVPFAKQKAAEKREFIEGIFDLGFIKEMNKIAKEESAAIVAENAAACARISVLTEAVERSKNDAEEFERSRTESVAERTATRDSKADQRTKAKEEIDSLSDVEEQWNKVQALVTAISEEKDSLRKEQSDLNKKKDELLKDFDPVFRKLTLKQGLMMIRLIDRECGTTPYYILKNYLGGATASFWQGVAKLFKGNLKQPYDRFGEDKDLEELVGIWQRGEFDNLYWMIFGKSRPEIIVPERYK